MISTTSVRFTILSPIILATFTAILFGCAESISIRTAPPPLQAYDQPYCPGPGYLWIPGYWAYGKDGYYFVPGMWQRPPEMGWMWTPGYWSCSDGEYFWHSGYWAKDVGFYGGINYGCGYTGSGYEGGYWKDNAFYYNSAVTNVNPSVVKDIYNQPAVNKDTTIASASYNGGTGGVIAKPTSHEEIAAREPHIPSTAIQNRPNSKAGMVNKQVKQLNFNYKIDPTSSRMDQIKIPNYQVINDAVRFFFCSGGPASKFLYRLKQNSDTLGIEEYHGPGPLQKQKVLFCVLCTISGLKTGQYFVKTMDGVHQIDIK
jgi:WXXGXW repeat (2 copies)